MNKTQQPLQFIGSVITESEVLGDLSEFKHTESVHTLDQKDGGKTLINQINSLVDTSSRKMLYEKPHERYRHTTALLNMLYLLKKRPLASLNESLDNITQYVKASSPFHLDTFKAPVMPQ